jgi:NAD(P)-dependent dehydrogenase (short-subunit alcohol dehydrogenase family)
MKIGIITGTGKGIGLSALKLLLKKKYKIISITKTKSKEVESLLKNKNFIKNIYHPLGENLLMDKKLVNEINKKYKIDFMVCNAGVRHRDSLQKMDIEKRKQTLNVNYHSNVVLIEELLKSYNKKRSSVSIVCISSIVGNFGFKDLSSYASSKMALEGFLKSIAVEYAKKNVRINLIAPGFIKSSYYSNFIKKQKKINKWILERTPMGRWGKPDEVSNVIEFLISQKSSYITGSTIYVDGGWSIS